MLANAIFMVLEGNTSIPLTSIGNAKRNLDPRMPFYVIFLKKNRAILSKMFTKLAAICFRNLTPFLHIGSTASSF